MSCRNAKGGADAQRGGGGVIGTFIGTENLHLWKVICLGTYEAVAAGEYVPGFGSVVCCLTA
jgi:hypothetical protein